MEHHHAAAAAAAADWNSADRYVSPTRRNIKRRKSSRKPARGDGRRSGIDLQPKKKKKTFFRFPFLRAALVLVLRRFPPGSSSS
jgi:hypothetical protein